MDGQSIVPVLSNAKAALQTSQSNVLNTENKILNLNARTLKNLQDENLEYIAKRLLTIDWINAGNPLIPNNFDPIAYLLNNRDILTSDMPPYEHFIKLGQFENWRKWEWMNQ